MTPRDILNLRLVNQQIASHRFKKVEDMVSWMGAIQAQDYPGGLWAIGLRTGKTKGEVEKAISECKIVRTWPMRGTLHFVSSKDIRWMLKLLTERVRASARGRHDQLGLREGDFTKSRKLLIKYLEGGKHITRKGVYELLKKAKIDPSNYRGLHIIGQFAQEGLICFAPHQEKQPAFGLLEEWIPKTKELNRQESIIEITKRYFTSHGPATIQDFVWWSGLKVVEAKMGIEANKLEKEVIEGKIYWFTDTSKISPKNDTQLLPPWDEYLVAYKDRSAAVDLPHFEKIFGVNGIFSPVILINGKVEGVWRRLTKKDRIMVNINLFSKPNSEQTTGINRTVENYSKFMGVPVEIKYETVSKK